MHTVKVKYLQPGSRDSIQVQRGAGAVSTFLHLHIFNACISNEAESLNVAQLEAKHGHLSGPQSSSEYLVVGEEGKVFSESRDVHDGHSARHLS